MDASRPGHHRRARAIAAAALVACAWSATLEAGPDVATKFTNQGSIVNTRHNLTQEPIGGGASQMDAHRNDYNEVCVYCHTPHGSNPNVTAPLWNRTAPNATYVTYDQLGSVTQTQPVTAPGPNSLTCLSCHDGTLGVDSIINMPNQNRVGTPSGNYSTTQFNAPQDNAFLSTWVNVSGVPASHVTLGDPATQNGGNQNVGCMVCHSSVGSGASFIAAADFDSFVIGTDLTNDHPIGVLFPTAPGTDFRQPDATVADMTFYDTNANGRADTGEIRLYDTGDGPEVECASCHDPHGVESAGQGSSFFPSFLRVNNTQSGVCLTCHNK